MPEYDQPQRGRASGAKFGVAGLGGSCAAPVASAGFAATCRLRTGSLLDFGAGFVLDFSAGFALGFWAGFIRGFGAGFWDALVGARPGVLRVLMR